LSFESANETLSAGTCEVQKLTLGFYAAALRSSIAARRFLWL